MSRLVCAFLLVIALGFQTRSEEHTSELQSLRHLVCRLLLDTASTEIYPLSLHDALPISYPGIAQAAALAVPGWTPEMIHVGETPTQCPGCLTLRWNARSKTYE